MRGATCRDLFQFKSTNLAATSKRAVALMGRVEADLPDYSWHLLQEVNRHPVGRVEINPQTMEGNCCVE